MTEATPEPIKKRAAILLIHGIGQQNPYQILDGFARGLINHYRRIDKGGNIQSIVPRLFKRQHENKVQSCITLNFSRSIGDSGVRTIELYEFYWAGMVQGQVSLAQLLKWCLRTSLPPLKLWSQQTTLVSERHKGFLKLLPTVVRELATAFALLLSIGLVFYPFILITANAAEFLEAGKGIVKIFEALDASQLGLFGSLVFGILIILELFVIFSILQIAFRLLFRRNPMESSMLNRWGEALLGLLIFLTLIVAGIGAILVSQNPDFSAVADLWRMLITPPVGSGIIAILLAFMGAKVLIDFVGDIPLYVDADEKSEFFRTRSEIKQTGVDLIKSLLVDEAEYEDVYIVGHSLGSVIAYDCINQLMREVRAGININTAKIKGMVTFGSPLDKTYYFFRDKVGTQESIRAQIQSFLHGFRKKSSGRNYDPYRFARYEMPSTKHVRWVNVYSTMDIVSDHLDFYDVDEQHQLIYLSPLTAHIKYWSDPKFYSIVAKLLEGLPTIDPAAKS